jgi:hypothetical protein
MKARRNRGERREHLVRNGQISGSFRLGALPLWLAVVLGLGGCFVFAEEGVLDGGGGSRDAASDSRDRDLSGLDGAEGGDGSDDGDGDGGGGRDADTDGARRDADDDGIRDAAAEAGDGGAQDDVAGADGGSDGEEVDEDDVEPECRVHSDCTAAPRLRCGPAGACQEGAEGEVCVPDGGHCREGALYCARSDGRCHDGSLGDPCDPGRFQCQEPLLECDEGGTCETIVGL